MGPVLPWLWLASLAPPSEVDAGTPHEARVEPARQAQVVVLLFDDQARALETLVRAVRAQFAGGAVDAVVSEASLPSGRLSDVAAEASRRARETSALGTFWFETTEGAVFVYLTDPPGRRVLVRRIDWQGPDDVAAAESVAVVVRSSAEALAAGSVIGMERVASAAPAEAQAGAPESSKAAATSESKPASRRVAAAEPLPPKPSSEAGGRRAAHRRGVHVDVRAGYVGSNLLDRLAWQHGLGLRLDVAFARRWAITVGYRQFLPGRVRGAVTTVRFDRYVPDVAVAFSPWLHPHAELGVAAVMAGEILRRRSQVDAGVAAPPTVRFVPVVAAGVDLRVRFVGWLWGTAGVRLEVPTVRIRYLEGAGDTGGTSVVAQTAPVRGAILVGFLARIRARGDRLVTRNGRKTAR